MTESPTFADSEPLRGPFGQLGVLGPRPPRAGSGARHLILTAGSSDPAGAPTQECSTPCREGLTE
eukprot:4725279-Alexandrium_andersonii.AAC.1